MYLAHNFNTVNGVISNFLTLLLYFQIDLTYCLKLTTVILFFTSIFLQTFSPVVMQVEFFLNRAAIEKALCVNKSKPQLHCNGKCFLAKQLKEAEKKDQQSSNTKIEKADLQLFADIETVDHTALYGPLTLQYGILPTAPLPSYTAYIFHPPSV